ncbi:MAG: M14 family metallopeptidase [Vicinamibacterales bacterium]
MTTRTYRLIATSALLTALAVVASAGMSAQAKPAAGAAPQAGPGRAAQDWASAPSSERTYKVKLDFNRWHDVAEIQADMRTLEKAYPKFLKYVSIGKSVGGRDLALMIVNNPDTGPDTSKPAMYIEANIHGNEIQGGEVCIYTIWYLMEHYGKIDFITNLVDERAFYIVPVINPDGRDFFMKGPGGNARTGHMPVDDDNDYQFDEDGPEDLNGNGVIEQIRKHVPGQGTHRKSAADARVLEPVPPGEAGDYVILGQEGVDRDGDGRVAEDGPGSYDPNRNYAADWQPGYVQGGAMDYPFQLPESQAVNAFLLAHPNVAGLQTYHNSGGMILRSPGAEQTGEYPAADVRVYDEIGRMGERMLPFYRYLVIWSGLYTVHGGVTDWGNDTLGILSFSNELWNNGQYFTSPDLKEQQRDPASPIAPRAANYFFNDYLEFGDQLTEWKPFTHPQFGEVEIGGSFRKTFGRVPPRFMNEELCHRNMAFTLYQADEMPRMAIGDTKIERLADGVFKVWIDLVNDKVAPTILAKAAQNNVVPPDLLTLDGKGVEVLSASWVPNKWRPAVAPMIDQKDLTRIMLRNGQPGRTTRTVQYLLKGAGSITVKYASVKGGTAQKVIALQ